MPRTTRAALKAQDFQVTHDNASGSDRETSPEETTTEQLVLGEVSGNTKAVIEAVGGEDKMPAKKGTLSRSKGKKIKAALKEVFSVQEKEVPNQATEIVRGDQQKNQEHRDATERDGLQAAPGISDLATEVPPEEIQPPKTSSQHPASLKIAAKEPASHIFEASDKEAKQPTSISQTFSKTHKFDPDVDMQQLSDHSAPSQTVDSFVTTIINRSPSKQSSMSPGQVQQSVEDSFTNDIHSRSPIKPVSRIEDSVEAMDALEEALEQVVIDLPNLPDDGLESPVKVTHNAPKSKQTAMRPTSDTTTQKRKIKPAPAAVKKPAIAGRKAAPRSKPEDSVKVPPLMSFSNSPVKTAPKPRVSAAVRQSLSTTKPAFVPAKSAKAPTKSTFALPGEAVAAKLKAQREERIKQEAEAEEEKKKFKARPVPRFSSATVRETAASKARQSLMIGSNVNNSNENMPPSSRGSRPSTSNSAANDIKVKKRPSSMIVKSSVNTTKPTPATSLTRTNNTATANTSATRSSRPISTIIQHTTTKSVVTQSDIATQRARAKEIFGREYKMKEDMERTKKEKEEAAKKARLEAAERGRAASREWAERQKLKKQVEMARKASTQAVVG